jgi:hypothetical protein
MLDLSAELLALQKRIQAIYYKAPSRYRLHRRVVVTTSGYLLSDNKF